MGTWKDNANKLRNETLQALLERAESEGLMPWDSPVISGFGAGGPINATTGSAYQGFNWLWLAMRGQRYWAGLKQWHKVGARVKEEHFLKGVEILIPRIVTRETDGEKKTILVGFKTGMVYSADMVDGWTPPDIKINPDALTPNETADGIIAKMPNAPTIIHGTYDCGAYSPPLDAVRMPNREWFKSSARYYKTLLHELAHATGHDSRLARREGMKAMNGLHAYSREELVAEFSAAMLVAQCGLSNETLDNSAAYVKHWAKYLQANPNVIFEAAADAQRAVNYILGKVEAKTKAA